MFALRKCGFGGRTLTFDWSKPQTLEMERNYWVTSGAWGPPMENCGTHGEYTCIGGNLVGGNWVGPTWACWRHFDKSKERHSFCYSFIFEKTCLWHSTLELKPSLEALFSSWVFPSGILNPCFGGLRVPAQGGSSIHFNFFQQWECEFVGRIH